MEVKRENGINAGTKSVQVDLVRWMLFFLILSMFFIDNCDPSLDAGVMTDSDDGKIPRWVRTKRQITVSASGLVGGTSWNSRMMDQKSIDPDVDLTRGFWKVECAAGG
jgi:hypothetical protein